MNEIIIRLNDWSSAWWQWVVHAGWQSGVVALIILGLVTAGRRWRAPLRYALLLVALIKFAIPPMLTMPTGVFTMAGPEITISERAPTPLERIPPPPGSYLARALSDPREMELEGEFIQRQLAQLPIAPAPLHGQSWLLLLHLAGSLMMLAWIARQWFLLRELRYNSVPIRERRLVDLLRSVSAELELRRAPDVFSSATARTPIAFGIFRPTVVLPEVILERLSDAELRTILAHEAAHFRRGDLWVNAAQLFVLTVWWFHPVCWLLNRALRTVREDCCDDLLLARSLTSQETYCDTLVRAARELNPARTIVAALALGENLHPVAQRLVRIMDATLQRSPRLGGAGILVALAVAGLALPGLRSQQAPAPGRVVRENVRPGLTLEEEDREFARRRRMPPAPRMAPNSEPVIPPEIASLSVPDLFERYDRENLSKAGGADLIRRAMIQKADETLPFLVKKLVAQTGANEVERIKAAELMDYFCTLQKWEAGRKVLPALIKALGDPNPQVREYAASSFIYLGPKANEAVPALLEALMQNTLAATSALYLIDGDSEKTAREVMALLEDTSRDLRFQSRIVEGSRGWIKRHPALVQEALLKAYASADWRMQRKIAMSLLYCEQRLAATEVIIQRTFKNPVQAKATGRGEFMDLTVHQLTEYIRHPRTSMEDQFAENELHFHFPNTKEALPALIDMLNDHERLGSSSAIPAIAQMGIHGEAAVPALVRFLNSKNPARFAAVHGIAAIYGPSKNPKGLEILTVALQHEDEKVRTGAARALQQFGAAAEPALSSRKMF